MDAHLRQQRARAGGIIAIIGDVGVVPSRVFRGHETVGRLRASAVNLAHQAVAVDGAGNCLPEFLVAKPSELDRINERFALSVGPRVLVEPQEIAFGADPEVHEPEPSGG